MEEEKVTLTKKELKEIIQTAYESGRDEELAYEVSMYNLGVVYHLAGLDDEMPEMVRYYYDTY